MSNDDAEQAIATLHRIADSLGDQDAMPVVGRELEKTMLRNIADLIERQRLQLTEAERKLREAEAKLPPRRDASEPFDGGRAG